MTHGSFVPLGQVITCTWRTCTAKGVTIVGHVGAYYSGGQRHLSLMGGGFHGESQRSHVLVDRGKMGGRKQQKGDGGFGSSGRGTEDTCLKNLLKRKESRM